eukprot:m.153240 g.153240  ORF g.153240 m.153240 type:complete len:542 (+) comp17462_c1_seq1:115-1740(+)
MSEPPVPDVVYRGQLVAGGPGATTTATAASASASKSTSGVRERVTELLARVHSGGEAAVRDMAFEIDGYRGDVHLSEERIRVLEAQVTPAERADIDAAVDRVKMFARVQLEHGVRDFEVEVAPGIVSGQRSTPLARVGCYAPGGLMAHIASAIMTVSTAAVAGAERIVLATPPRRSAGAGGGRASTADAGKGVEAASTPAAAAESSGPTEPDPRIVYAARRAGAHHILVLGGVQAIGALRLGLFLEEGDGAITNTKEPADAVIGPGNAYVAEAKRQLAGEGCVIDVFAGPTEICVLALPSQDPSAPPLDAELIATDIVSQAEHGPTSPCWLFTTDRALAETVSARVPPLIALLPEPNRLAATAAWRDFGEILVLPSDEDVAAVCDTYAPEHVEVFAADEERLRSFWLPRLRNYGSLFLGDGTSVTHGDKGAAGTNHVLPTRRAGVSSGGLSVHKLRKTTTFSHPRSLAQAASDPTVRKEAFASARMAAVISRREGMEGHARAADARTAKLAALSNLGVPHAKELLANAGATETAHCSAWLN